ncbi:hypothetical protein Hanom_Chr02g00159741 [Helianthus anomalus]
MSYAQTMPVIWRVLYVLNKLADSHGLNFGIQDLSSVYSPRTLGFSRCVFQILLGQFYMVLRATQNDNDLERKILLCQKGFYSRWQKASLEVDTKA